MTKNTKSARAENPVIPGWRIEARTAATPLPPEAWLPAYYDTSDHRAIKALAAGTATPEQQMKALGWIFYATGYRNSTFRPGDPRISDFLQGARHIGVQIYSLLELPIQGSADDEQGTR